MAVVDDGKEAVTHFNVLEHFKDYTLVECQLETGRTHQIRVHMKYIGFPLVGDQSMDRKDIGYWWSSSTCWTYWIRTSSNR